jgi:hypothetical protein
MAHLNNAFKKNTIYGSLQAIISGRFVLSRLFSRYIRGFHISFVSNAIFWEFRQFKILYDAF